jgi:hypothetical protein
MALSTITWLKGREGKNGLAGKLAHEFPRRGTATVVNGQTAIVVTDAAILATDIIETFPITKGTNAAYVVGYTISAGTSFTITVSADPGSGGFVIGYQIRHAA